MLDDITDNMLENGNSFESIDAMDAESFFNYLERKSQKDLSTSKDSEALSAEEYFNRF